MHARGWMDGWEISVVSVRLWFSHVPFIRRGEQRPADLQSDRGNSTLPTYDTLDIHTTLEFKLLRVRLVYWSYYGRLTVYTHKFWVCFQLRALLGLSLCWFCQSVVCAKRRPVRSARNWVYVGIGLSACEWPQIMQNFSIYWISQQKLSVKLNFAWPIAEVKNPS